MDFRFLQFRIIPNKGKHCEKGKEENASTEQSLEDGFRPALQPIFNFYHLRRIGTN